MRAVRPLLIVGLVLILLNGTHAAELARLHVYPEAIQLTGARDRQGVVVLAELADGSTRDVTGAATFQLDQPLAEIVNGFLAPKADGQATLTITWQGQTVQRPVVVKSAAVIEPINFRNDVLAVLTKTGCNSGKCHGAASGKDGFRLSLFGYDPSGDYDRITREAGGRRVNLANPNDCLLTNKATGRVPHTGGQRVVPDSENDRIIRGWLEAGAPADPDKLPKPVGIEVYPPEAVFAQPGDALRLVVKAKYSDGTDRDVTRFSVFLSNNDAAATVSESGIVQASGPGESFILARFDEFTQGSAIIVRPGQPFTPSPLQGVRDIDQLVLAKLNKLHVTPSGPCSDEVFLRRVFIDLIGLLPTTEDREKFLTSTDPRKRERLVDELLAREEFQDIWGMKFAELLQIRTINGISEKALQGYNQWLRDRLKAGVTLDKIVQELLPAVGGSFDNPAVNYFQTETSPQLLAENVAQVFLGTRLQCAQCHNHPFDRWTMDDYYGFAAFFSQIGYKTAQDPRELTIFNAGNGEMRHPVGNRLVMPKFLAGEVVNLPPGTDYRAALAQWIASPNNTAFAQNFGNLVWAHFFGRGIVEPVDDVRISNPPSNPALLKLLGEKAVQHRFDVKKLAREICLSHTYQRSTQRNETNQLDDRNFSRQTVRRMRAEVLLDCITQVTETTNRFAGLPLGGRAVQIPDGRTPNYFLTTFGRAARTTACSCEVKTTPTLSQALHLLNGETTTGKIAQGQVVEKLLAKGLAPAEVSAALYVRCLGRMPTATEATRIEQKLAASPDAKLALQDLFWALLNSNEFLFNR